MKVVLYPSVEEWNSLLQRPAIDSSVLEGTVMEIINTVKEDGDKALFEFARQFDGTELNDLAVQPAEFEAAGKQLTAALKDAIRTAKNNIYRFHREQFKAEEPVETAPGISCWRKWVGIEKVGLYIPGGSAPLFSTVLMLGIPAAIAGCKEVVLCTPPDKEGNIHPAILYAAQQAGIKRIFKAGGAQAVAAMAYGTETIPAVYKIFGPGNQYVTCAKQLVQRDGVAIDMPAGPSEVCVLADESANPQFVAADLLSQAEHGADSQVLLVTTDETLVGGILEEVYKQLETLPRKKLAALALEHSKAIVMKDLPAAMDLINAYAPEHLIISCKDDEAIGEQVVNAGSVFLGNYSPESAGDYASGTNHTLPTNGFAKAYSGVSIDSFVKKITYQKLSGDGLHHIASAIIEMAEAEGLQAHANAVKIRR
ncbi:MAG: histidinol dehydrogenase [Chitinophagaceae bacterium]|nr:histidinol dehydrogenase [Chitinophagaceae bacterium]MCW5927492.1 histidinol dehydrogenase [Chitinophagaceae bacterium]